MPDAYSQSLEALLSQSAASKNESHAAGVVTEWEYSAAVAVSGVSGAKTHVYTPAPGESKVHNRLPDLILSSELKPLVQHMPHPLQSVWSPGRLSCPP
nr:hypothetical protein [Tanacetum cinerariifolium]